MICPDCKELARGFDDMYARYIAAFYKIYADVPDERKLDMERAKAALDEHRLVCDSRNAIQR